jgi:hypothetical protein
MVFPRFSVFGCCKHSAPVRYFPSLRVVENIVEKPRITLLAQWKSGAALWKKSGF